MTTTTNRSTREQNYRRAMEASPDIQALETMVRLIASLGPPKGDEPMCYACLWESGLKPLATLVVGWERGRGVESAIDPDTPWQDRVVSLSDVDLDTGPREKATFETETWLRGQEAFDAVIGVWLKLLEDVDPACGHGLPLKKVQS